MEQIKSFLLLEAVSKAMQPFFVNMRQLSYFEDKNYLS